MCTPEEAKLFIKAVESLKGKPVNLFDWDMYPDNRMLYPMNLDEYLIPEMETEFPIKNRSISRKHHASKMRKHDRCLRSMEKEKHGWSMYQAGLFLDKRTTHKSRKYSVRERDALADYYRGSNFKDHEEFIEHFDLYDILTPAQEVFLREKGIFLEEKTRADFMEEQTIKSIKRELDSRMVTVGYEIIATIYYAYPDSDTFTFGFSRDKKELEKAIPEIKREFILEGTNDFDIYIKPVREYTPRQKQECKELGYHPVPGLYKL